VLSSTAAVMWVPPAPWLAVSFDPIFGIERRVQSEHEVDGLHRFNGGGGRGVHSIDLLYLFYIAAYS
jgi:hypothetical protein